MKNLKNKLKKQGGFTLVEMLIVVAIIAILIAVSIPMVNGALEKARDATDQANERAAKAVAMIVYLGGIGDNENEVTFAGGGTSYESGTAFTAIYDAANGCLKKADATVTAYGKCTKGNCYTTTGVTGASAHTNQVLSVTVSADGVVALAWTDAS